MNQQQQLLNQDVAIHPTAAIDDINRIENATQTSHPLNTGNGVIANKTQRTTQTSHSQSGGHHNGTSLWMKKPENTSNSNQSAVSSSTSEYGSSSSDGSHQYPHYGKLGRPVADKNAFIQSDSSSRHWQNTMTPAERAKQLAEEMDQALNERRRSSSDASKSLKIGGAKDIKLD